MGEVRELWEPRGDNRSRSEVRAGSLEKGVSELTCEERVHMSLLREWERNSRKQNLPVQRPEVSKSLALVQRARWSMFREEAEDVSRLLGNEGPWMLCKRLTVWLGCSDPGIHSLTCSLYPPQAWVQERLPLAMQTERGSGLQAVQQHIKKNQVSRFWVRE